MVEGFITNADKLEFKQIVLKHLKKILEISSVEFHGGYHKRVFSGSQYYDEYVPDNRKGYIQAVESLSRVLLPHFDKQMEEDYKDYKKQIENLLKKLEAKKLGLVNVFEKEIEGIKANKIYDRSLLEVAHFLFEKLNRLLKRVDYLNKAIYTENDEDVDIAEVD